MRVLFWDRTGYAILAKRLERGTFRLAQTPPEGATRAAVDAAELSLLLEGIDLRMQRDGGVGNTFSHVAIGGNWAAPDV